MSALGVGAAPAEQRRQVIDLDHAAADIEHAAGAEGLAGQFGHRHPRADFADRHDVDAVGVLTGREGHELVGSSGLAAL